MSKKEPMRRVCLRCDEETAALLERIAVSEGITRSEVIRRLVQDGITAQEVPDNEKDLQALFEPVFREVLKPYMERLAAICAKTTQISAAAFFMEACLVDSTIGPDTAATLAVKAHRVGCEYLALTKNKDLNDIVSDLLERNL